MRLILLLLLCCVAPGATFVAKVAPSAASKSRLGRHDDGTRSSSSAFSGRRPSGRRPLFPHALRVRPDGGGRDDTPGENSTELRVVDKKVDAVEEDIQAVGREIGSAGEKIEAVEAALSGGPPYLGITDLDLLLKKEEQLRKEKEQLRKKEEQLRKEKEQLRKEKEQLREKELLLLKMQPAAAVSLAGAVFQPGTTQEDKNVEDFGAALTKAALTENTLELPDGTCFLGRPELASKIFIRPCYRKLSELILGGASGGTWLNIVVTGTPGIGKSIFGFFLLYLLRLRGKSVVYEWKGSWYRFSDEGSVRARQFSDFVGAGYLGDPNSWYLSDPKDQPEEIFSGTTVVLVSPKSARVNQFMKQGKSKRFFMPVWLEDELLECGKLVFPHVTSITVKDAFREIGGVARGVFDKDKLEQIKTKMEKTVSKTDHLVLLEAVASGESGTASTDVVGDSLFHMFPRDEKDYDDYVVDFASERAKELVSKQVKKMSELAFKSVLSYALEDKRTQPVGALLFECHAHKEIGEAPRDFGMMVLTPGGKFDLGADLLKLDFCGTEEFGGGQTFPEQELERGTYYYPRCTNFPAIDSFGVDRSGGTLYFFQVESAMITPVKGKRVQGYWDIAVGSNPSIKNCVLVYVVPMGEVWNATKGAKANQGKAWLTDADASFQAKCDVCVIGISISSIGHD